MRAKPLPSQERLLALFGYSVVSGAFWWRATGQRAGWSQEKGYRCVDVDGSKFLVHRLIWKMVTGHDPDFIDHENLNTGDNWWLNLRDCSKSQNQGNREARIDNASGIKNVHWDDGRKKWVVQIKLREVRYMRRCRTLAGAIALQRLKSGEMYGQFARAA